jgi:alpha-2-macroglobulin
MRNVSWKKLGFGALAVALVVTAIFYFTDGKGNKTLKTTINPAFAEYISSYTAGMVGSGSTIRVMLSSEGVDSASVGEESSVKLFDLSPSVSGKIVWLDRRTVEFRPETRFTSGQTYEVAFNLGRIMQVPKELSTFEYTFQVIPQSFEVQIENVKPYIKTDLKRQKIEGFIYTADYADNAAIEKMLMAQQEGNATKS